jgi:exopolyphosphatase / guanosine-5'-triphosphate,3'-diphosphate pyrophosphatase
MKRYASIDIGTNTVLLAICDISESGELYPVIDLQELPRLGQYVDRNRTISDTSLDRVLLTLNRYIERCKQLNVHEIITTGTSALRDAGNREDVIRKISESTGLTVKILTGLEEAECTYLGAISGLIPAKNKLIGVLDIGGGSTEFSVGSGSKIKYNTSLDIGCVRLTERYFRTFPPSEDDLTRARQTVEDVLRIAELPKPGRLIGVAGTITTLAAIDLRLSEFSAQKLEGHIIHLSGIRKLLEIFRGLSIEEVRRFPQIAEGREDILLAGILILLEFLKEVKLSSIVTNTKGLRYGVIIKNFRNRQSIHSQSIHGQA